MRVGILGGGPAGLYTAILLKNENPDHQIKVIERNPAGVTWGFGVVLSDRTLTAFQNADPKSFAEITAHQSTWKAIDTIHRGERVHCGGHYYLGIGRKRLLDILQKRCEELGVELHFETEENDLSVFADCDLIVAGDGVNSIVRKTYNDHFQAEIVRSKSKYIWLGVEYIPSSFTFIFHETEHGLFQAHMYPFDEKTSTCIVQCRDEVWERAGLDKLDEAASVQFCKDLLKPYLGDVNFLSNRSLWSTFQMVTTKNWSHKNIVLIGDAVHTAHWSIGSGTKLAMEDAIALVEALKQHDEIPVALAHYQQERKPVTERLQHAGRVSELYCENIERYTHLDPLQFAFQMMIRSRRMDYETLKQRDPEFIASVDRWFAARAAEEAGVDGVGTLAPVECPLKLRNLLLPNRFVAALSGLDTAQDGLPNHSYFERLKRLANAGAGLVLTDPVAVGAGDASKVGLYRPDHMEAWKSVLRDIHAESGAKVALQLGHATRAAGRNQVKAEFVAAAGMAAKANADMLQLDLSSLLDQSVAAPSAVPVEKRIGAVLELVSAVRAAWPAEKPLAVALPIAGVDDASAEEAANIAHLLKEHGCDLVQVAAPTGVVAAVSEQIRNQAQVRTMIQGSATGTAEANTLVAGARADLYITLPDQAQ